MNGFEMCDNFPKKWKRERRQKNDNFPVLRFMKEREGSSVSKVRSNISLGGIPGYANNQCLSVKCYTSCPTVIIVFFAW